jgi:hypothetical protein
MNADSTPDWADAPEGWDWLAQDEDGWWYWYGVRPQPSLGGGVWRAPSKAQRRASCGAPNPDWAGSLRSRPR